MKLITKQRLKNMNTLPKWKKILISWLAGNEPIFMNYDIFTKNLPASMSVVMAPLKNEVKNAEYWSEKAFIVPTRNVID